MHLPLRVLFALSIFRVSTAYCQDGDTTPTPAPSEASAPAVLAPSPLKLGAYVEAFYQWNTNRPSNGITNYRAFDNRHDAFTLANVALDAQADYQDVIARLTLQIGHTPSTYYAAEPSIAATSGANATGAAMWKYLQQAYGGYRVADVLTLTVGLFLSPIGPESMAIHEDWTWSRSNLFLGLPFYHTGARASYAWRAAWSFTLAAYNGWNSVVDDNRHKTMAAQIAYARGALSAAALYVGGRERVRRAPEGEPWRHLFDAHATWSATSRLSLRAHANAGFEQSRFGHARWAAGSLTARVRVLPMLFVAARGDRFHERVARRGDQRASPLFWPVPWVSSATGTVELRPNERASLRAEYRHDRAAGPMFFGGDVLTAPDTGAFVATRRKQSTLTLGATVWF